MTYVRVCPICGSKDLSLPRRIESMPGFSVNERCYCNDCGQESVPLLIDENSVEYDDKSEEFQIYELVPLDTINYSDKAIVSEIKWQQDGIKPVGRNMPYTSYKDDLIEEKERPNLMIWDLNGINNAQTHYRILKETIKHKYNIILDPGICDISDIFDAFTMDAAKIVCNSICAKSPELFEEAYEISDHIVPCVCVQNEKVLWKSSKGEKDLQRTLRNLYDIGFEFVEIINTDLLGTNTEPDYGYLSKLSDRFDGIIYCGGIQRHSVSKIQETGISGAVVEPFRID